MNEKRDLEALLSDVLIDPSNEEFFRTSARLNFRRHVQRRNVVRSIAAGLAIACAAFLGLMPLNKEQSQKIAAAAKPTQISQSAKPDDASIGLSDEELLRSFPPGSCFLAEVNGKKVLVFADESMRKQLLN